MVALKADTRVPDGFDAVLREALWQEATLATAFRFRVSRRDDQDPAPGSDPGSAHSTGSTGSKSTGSQSSDSSSSDNSSSDSSSSGGSSGGGSGGGKAGRIAALGWMEWTVHIRSSGYELPFGDQAIAITTQRFNAVRRSLQSRALSLSLSLSFSLQTALLSSAESTSRE